MYFLTLCIPTAIYTSILLILKNYIDYQIIEKIIDFRVYKNISSVLSSLILV